MSEWKEYRIGEICDTQTGPFGSQLHNEDYVEEGTPIVTVEHLGSKNFTTQNLPFVSDEDTKRLSKYTLKEGDIVFSRVGSVDRCSYVSTPYNGWLFSGRCLRVRPEDNEILDSQFLYYHFSSEKIKTFIRNIAVGATMPSINTKLLNEVPISIPPLSIQKKIADILSSLDEKIETNRKINARLEALAQAIFKSWFIDFEPFGGKMPKDWENITLKSCTNKISDGVHNTVVDTPNTNYYLLSCKNIIGGKLNINDKERTIDFNTFQKLRKRTCLEKDDILLSSVGTIGELVFLTENLENIEFQRSVAMIKANKDIINPIYLFYWLRSQKNIIKNMAHGAVQQCLFLKDIEEIPIRLPSIGIMNSFASLGKAIQNYIFENNKESARIAELRDTFLPKLMSGELIPE